MVTLGDRRANPRLDVAGRMLAAVAGSYAVATAAATALAVALPLPRDQAAMAATLLALLTVPVTAMACTWARDAGRAWAGTGLACAAALLLAALAGWRP